MLTRAILPSPAYAWMLQHDRILLQQLRSELQALDGSLVLIPKSTSLELHHARLEDRPSLYSVLNEFLAANVDATCEVLPMHYLASKDKRDQLWAMPELKTLAPQRVTYYLDKAGFDDTRFVLTAPTLDFNVGQIKGAVAAAAGIELYFIKRSAEDPTQHIAMLKLGPGLDKEEGIKQVRRLCLRGKLVVEGRTLGVKRYLVKDTTITMVHTKANASTAAPGIRAVQQALSAFK